MIATQTTVAAAPAAAPSVDLSAREAALQQVEQDIAAAIGAEPALSPPVAAPEPESAEAPAESPVAAPAEPPAQERDKRPTRLELTQRMARIRAEEAKLRARRAEIAASEQQIAEREREVQRWAELARRDPDALMREAARAAGITDAALYERATRQRLQTHDPHVAQALEEVERLRAEIAQDRAEALRRDQERDARVVRERTEQHHARCIDIISRIPDGPHAREYPHLAALPREWLARHARDAVAYAAEHAPETTVPELARALDALVGEELEYIRSRLPTSAEPAAHGAPAERQGQPGRVSPAVPVAGAPAPRGGSPPTAAQAATTSGRERLPTQAERDAQIDDLLERSITIE